MAFSSASNPEQSSSFTRCESSLWGQRVLRVYDPDGHVIEIGEAMEMVVRRLQGQGLLLGQTCEKTGMPEAFVAQAMVSHDTGASQRTCD